MGVDHKAPKERLDARRDARRHVEKGGSIRDVLRGPWTDFVGAALLKRHVQEVVTAAFPGCDFGICSGPRLLWICTFMIFRFEVRTLSKEDY